MVLLEFHVFIHTEHVEQCVQILINHLSSSSSPPATQTSVSFPQPGITPSLILTFSATWISPPFQIFSVSLWMFLFRWLLFKKNCIWKKSRTAHPSGWLKMKDRQHLELVRIWKKWNCFFFLSFFLPHFFLSSPPVPSHPLPFLPFPFPPLPSPPPFLSKWNFHTLLLGL